MKKYVVFTFDVLVAAFIWALSFWLRFNFEPDDFYASVALSTMPYVIVVQGLVFWLFGLYRGMWRYASLLDLRRIAVAIVSSVLLTAMTLVLLHKIENIPRSVWLLDAVLLLVSMGGARAVYRLYREHLLLGTWSSNGGEPVIILGAGDAAVSFLKDALRNRKWKVLGLLDDDQGKHRRVVCGVRVLGSMQKLPELAKQWRVKTVIMAIPSATYPERRKIIELCKEAEAEVLSLPSIFDIMQGKLQISQLHKVQFEDLLGRQPVTLDDAGLHTLIEGRVIMVTGAGGSIGSELCRQIVAFKPKKILFYEVSEPSLYALEQEFSQRAKEASQKGDAPSFEFLPLIGDVKNVNRLRSVMETHRPAIVFHAAAYKHVPLMEEGNAWEAIQNNVRGTYNVLNEAAAAGVNKFVLISTDKAVNPTNVMGASKRLAELVCQGVQTRTRMSVVIVRFGNVLGSQGSVIPKFKDQIARGGPVTITHPEISRYFMSIPEASQLVMQAALMGQGGEIFVLDMGIMIRIVDLARDMIRLSGADEESMKIEFTGLRPGEKLYEELFNTIEKVVDTHHPKVRIAKSASALVIDLPAILEWIQSDATVSDERVKAGLKQWIPEYEPQLPAAGQSVVPTVVPVGTVTRLVN